MSFVASLPMYRAPAWAHAAFWDAMRRHLLRRGVHDAPDALAEPDDLPAHWRSADMLFSQTCGRPLASGLAEQVAILGTPHYDVPGCEGPYYRSLFVVRDGDRARRIADLPGRRAAINALDSHSGFAQLVATLTPFARGRPVLADPVVSGSHLLSLGLVRGGGAEFAAIDCVTWALASRDEPAAIAGLRIVGRSPKSLGLPFIASARLGPFVIDALSGALSDTIRDPRLSGARRALKLCGLSRVSSSAYDGHSAGTTTPPALRGRGLLGALELAPS